MTKAVGERKLKTSRPVQKSLDFKQGMAVVSKAVSFEDVIAQAVRGAKNKTDDEPVILTGEALAHVRSWVKRYGFDRLPKTFGELKGMHAYCVELEQMSGVSTVPAYLLNRWQQDSIKTQAKYNPARVVPLQLYLQHNLPALREHHAKTRTLERLGNSEWPHA